jgi:hypothetical protein
MTLKSLFQKPVDRPIEGVIKADDDASLRLEIEEYVLTNEIESRLEKFLDAYCNYTVANGVWVSGFFGSGKSHLLKMLAFLLENREIDGTSALDLFLPKCGDNEILRGDLKRAVAIPSKSILFNIDQKADVISKTQVDALLAVFVKVFDELSGYYGKQGYIAQFERHLDSRGVYDGFKTAYHSISGQIWQKGREQALLESTNIAKAYAKATGENESAATGILEKYRSQYRVSIEDFAEQVNAYIERQGPGFRLNFFVDEVGQYIADNVKLMTNLQTIAESLATKCRGRAWVIVTAQEDMNSVVGEMSRQRGNDFTKIQARFANRMKLTSANVSEVIQKRLLVKTDEGIQLLSTIYHAEANNFKTLFDFADGSATYQNFKDRDEFIHSYPFIPYQFALFQLAIQNLSVHNAFEGKHSSVGERSMLGVFQQVAIQIGDRQHGHLATFDLMFEGIRTALKSNIQRSILQAEQHLGNPFAVQLLKALFLVKYVKEFKPTLRNLCVLMLGAFGQSLPQLRKQVEEALNLLEQQTYIHRTAGDQYEYLTDEEKDIEQEIKNTEVELADVAAELDKIVFDQIVKTKKIRYDDNSQDYAFSRKLDDRLFGKDHELAINVITPFHENAADETALRLASIGRDELRVVIPPDDRLLRDVMMLLRTAKYVRQNISITQQESVKRILADKSTQNDERARELKQRVQALLGQAKLIVSGGDVDVNADDAMTRIVRGFHHLIARAYPNLRMLPKLAFSENDVAKCLNPPEPGPFGEPIKSLSEAEQELLAFIQSNKRGGLRTTLKGVLERFERKPYGWYYAAVLCTVASLSALSKVEISADSNILETHQLEKALRNTHQHGNILLETQMEFPASVVRKLKEFHESFFDSPPRASEAKLLGHEVSGKFQDLNAEVTTLAARAALYPFQTALAPLQEKLKEMIGRPYAWYLNELPAQHDTLLDLKESTLDPIRKFMTGPQKAIFDSARAFVQSQEPNFAYIAGNDPAQVTAALQDPECFKGNRMQQLKSLVDGLQGTVKSQLELEIEAAQTTVNDLKARLHGMADYVALSPDRQEHIETAFAEFGSGLRRQSLIAVIRDYLRRFETADYQRMLSQVSTWALPVPLDPPPNGGEVTSVPRLPATAPAAIEYVPSRAIRVAFAKAWLADEADVDGYIESLRNALLAEIRTGKRIQI